MQKFVNNKLEENLRMTNQEIRKMIMVESSIIYTKNGDYTAILNHIKKEIDGKKEQQNQ